MAVDTGLSYQDMDALARDLNKAGADVQDLQARVTAVLGRTQWVGASATRFREAWDGDYKKSLQNLQQALQGLAQEVNTRKQRFQEADRV